MYNQTVANSIFCPIGAFVWWAITLFKGTFDNQYNEKYKNRNFATGVIFLIVTLIIFSVSSQ